jgi:hypothetical protein
VLPPALAWLNAFATSTGLALDQPIVADAQSGVNVLVYKVSVKWVEPISTHHWALVWNLFQKWAAKNDATPSSNVDVREVRGKVLGFSVNVHTRERLRSKNHHPMG